MLSSLPRPQGPLGSTTTPGEGATPRAPGSSTRSGRSPAHTGPGADPSPGPGADPWGWIPSRRSPGSAWEGVPRAAQAPRSRRTVDGRGGAAGTTPGSGGWARAGLQGVWSAHEDRRGRPWAGRTRAGRESRVAEAGGRGGPRAVSLARGRPLTQTHDTCQRARSGRAGGGVVPGSPPLPGTPRRRAQSGRTPARSCDTDGTARTSRQSQAVTFAGTAWGRGPTATPLAPPLAGLAVSFENPGSHWPTRPLPVPQERRGRACAD